MVFLIVEEGRADLLLQVGKGLAEAVASRMLVSSTLMVTVTRLSMPWAEAVYSPGV